MLAAPVVAQNFTEDQIKALAIQAILENPHVVMEAVAILKEQEDAAKAKQSASLLTSRRDALERDLNAPVLGNIQGDVVHDSFITCTPITSRSL